MEAVAAKSYSKLVYRISIGSFFFLLGLCFSSWASRIPTIQQYLHLSEGRLGLILFALPMGSLVSLPLSGWLVNRLGSSKVVVGTTLFYGIVLLAIGYASATVQLVVCLLLFGVLGNMVNISVNTQAIRVEEMYGRSVMASFHGLWSLAGFAGASIGQFMIGKSILPHQHFLYIMLFLFLVVALNFKYTIPDKGSTEKQVLFAKPEKSLITLGLIAFCSMTCEGAMFDWSNIYFQKVVTVKKGWMGAGLTSFMCTMALGRFFADAFTNKFGPKLAFQCSGLLTAAGLLLAVLFPYLVTALIGFLLVGFGVSSVVPLVYSLAGKSKILSPGMALAAVSSIGFLGFLLGPPIIGLIASASSLRVSFAVIAGMALCVALLPTFKKIS